MFYFILLILVLPITYGDHNDYQGYDPKEGRLDKDGPCPKPVINLGSINFTGTWYAVSSSYEYMTKTTPCFVWKSEEKEKGIIYSASYFRNASTLAETKTEDKYVALNEPGRLTGFDKNADGSYEKTGWIYSIIKTYKKTFIVFACKEEGDKHFDLHLVFTPTLPMPKETKVIIKEAYDATGDTRPLYFYNHGNCNLKLD